MQRLQKRTQVCMTVTSKRCSCCVALISKHLHVVCRSVVDGHKDSGRIRVPVVCLERLKILVSQLPPHGRRQSDPLPASGTEGRSWHAAAPEVGLIIHLLIFLLHKVYVVLHKKTECSILIIFLCCICRGQLEQQWTWGPPARTQRPHTENIRSKISRSHMPSSLSHSNTGGKAHRKPPAPPLTWNMCHSVCLLWKWTLTPMPMYPRRQK